VRDALIILMFSSNQNRPSPSRFTTRFLSSILISPLLRSFLAPNILMPQFGRYWTLLRWQRMRFSICICGTDDGSLSEA
jgi:hypothetical protein